LVLKPWQNSQQARTQLTPLPNESIEALHFWRLRYVLLRTVAALALSRQRLRTAMIALLTIIFWVVMYALFHEGFDLIWATVSHEGTRVQIAHAIFNVFFLALSVMLVVSAGIITYSALYRSPESQFLLTLPIRVRRIALYKFQETVFIACWGFFLLGSPLLLAYGQVAGAPWYYYALLPVFMVSFVSIPCGIGAILCLVIVRFAPQFRKPLIIALGVFGLFTLITLAILIVREASPQNMVNIDWFQSMLNRLKTSEQRLLPSWWLSTGLLEAAHPAAVGGRNSRFESMMFLCVLLANALAVYSAIALFADRLYVSGRSAIFGASSSRQVTGPSFFDRGLSAILSPLSEHVRHLLLKDFRILRRDTMQWMQLVIFSALLVFYFLNIRRLHHGQPNGTWLVMISFLNVAVVGLLLATFTTRFIFPLISLEGRRFWVLGTLPIDRRTVVWSKFWFAVAIALIPCSLLILLSDVMLGIFRVYPRIAVMHQITMLFLCLGLCGIATGLGARFPNLRETSPAKIASGFGGTLTLVLSATLILTSILLSAVPTFGWIRSMAGIQFSTWYRCGMIESGCAIGMILGCAAAVLPMWLGNRSFRRLEL
jgi:ABC-2 type transport system permease protein